MVEGVDSFLVDAVEACADGWMGFFESVGGIVVFDAEVAEVDSWRDDAPQTEDTEPERDCLDAFSDCTGSFFDDVEEGGVG